MRSVKLMCTICEVIVRFEQPPCPDGHGDLCSEWYCTECGDAILLAPAIALPRRRPAATTRRRRAA